MDEAGAPDQDLLEEAKQRTAHLTAHLPDKVEIAALSLNSKLPFKAVSLREYLFHRMCQLANAAVEQFEADRAIPATLLTRGCMETFALMYALHLKLKTFLEGPDIVEIDGFFMNSLFASRVGPNLRKAKNILAYVDMVDKLVPKFRASYDSLSEYAHPNWSGTMGSFGRIDREAFEVQLGPREGSPWKASGLNAFTGALLGFEAFYNKIAGQLYAFNDYFEKHPPPST